MTPRIDSSSESVALFWECLGQDVHSSFFTTDAQVGFCQNSKFPVSRNTVRGLSVPGVKAVYQPPGLVSVLVAPTGFLPTASTRPPSDSVPLLWANSANSSEEAWLCVTDFVLEQQHSHLWLPHRRFSSETDENSAD